eukprot:GEMP01088381.1.p1 GENE.GEMP01088381.1~~GEMP01088381.1.p1  ORF type:complete len:247 (+),score=57.43 GEMP01088381.1:137-877(+)
MPMSSFKDFASGRPREAIRKKKRKKLLSIEEFKRQEYVKSAESPRTPRRVRYHDMATTHSGTMRRAAAAVSATISKTDLSQRPSTCMASFGASLSPRELFDEKRYFVCGEFNRRSGFIEPMRGVGGGLTPAPATSHKPWAELTQAFGIWTLPKHKASSDPTRMVSTANAIAHPAFAYALELGVPPSWFGQRNEKSRSTVFQPWACGKAGYDDSRLSGLQAARLLGAEGEAAACVTQDVVFIPFAWP